MIDHTDLVLLGLPVELIKENIKAQVGDERERNDYFSPISYQINMLIRSNHEHEDTVKALKDTLLDINNLVIDTISDAFGIDVDITYSNYAESEQIATQLYDIFVLSHEDLLYQFIINMIDRTKTDIVDHYGTVGRDVTSISVKEIHKSRRDRIIMSNIPEIVDDILLQAKEMDPMDFIDVVNDGRYSWLIIKELYEENVITGSFTKMYCSSHYFGGTINNIKTQLYHSLKYGGGI